MKRRSSVHLSRVSGRSDLERLQYNWIQSCEECGFSISKRALNELEKRISRSGTKGAKAKLDFRNCELIDEMLIFLIEQLAVEPILSKLDISSNSLTSKSIYYLLNLLRGQVYLTQQIPLNERYEASLLGEVIIGKQKQILDDVLLNDIDMFSGCLRVENARAFIYSVYLQNGSPDVIVANVFYKIWTEVLGSLDRIAASNVLRQGKMAGSFVLTYEEMEPALLFAMTEDGTIPSISKWQRAKINQDLSVYLSQIQQSPVKVSINGISTPSKNQNIDYIARNDDLEEENNSMNDHDLEGNYQNQMEVLESEQDQRVFMSPEKTPETKKALETPPSSNSRRGSVFSFFSKSPATNNDSSSPNSRPKSTRASVSLGKTSFTPTGSLSKSSSPFQMESSNNSGAIELHPTSEGMEIADDHSYQEISSSSNQSSPANRSGPSSPTATASAAAATTTMGADQSLVSSTSSSKSIKTPSSLSSPPPPPPPPPPTQAESMLSANSEVSSVASGNSGTKPSLFSKLWANTEAENFSPPSSLAKGGSSRANRRASMGSVSSTGTSPAVSRSSGDFVPFKTSPMTSTPSPLPSSSSTSPFASTAPPSLVNGLSISTSKASLTTSGASDSPIKSLSTTPSSSASPASSKSNMISPNRSQKSEKKDIPLISTVSKIVMDHKASSFGVTSATWLALAQQRLFSSTMVEVLQLHQKRVDNNSFDEEKKSEEKKGGSKTGNSHELEGLVLRSNRLSDVDFLKSEIVSRLVFLDLAGNSIKGSLPDFFPRSLVRLDLSYNQITDVTCLIVCPNIQYLDLSHNHIKALTRLPLLLEYLDLSYNDIESRGEFRILSLCSKLRYLMIQENPVLTTTDKKKLHASLRSVVPSLREIDGVPKHVLKSKSREASNNNGNNNTPTTNSNSNLGSSGNNNINNNNNNNELSSSSGKSSAKKISKQEQEYQDKCRMEEYHKKMELLDMSRQLLLHEKQSQMVGASIVLNPHQVEELTRRLVAHNTASYIRTFSAPDQSNPLFHSLWGPSRQGHKKITDVIDNQNVNGASHGLVTSFGMTESLSRSFANRERFLTPAQVRALEEIDDWIAEGSNELARAVAIFNIAIQLSRLDYWDFDLHKNFQHGLQRIPFISGLKVPPSVERSVSIMQEHDHVMKAVSHLVDQMLAFATLLQDIDDLLISLEQSGNYSECAQSLHVLMGTKAGKFVNESILRPLGHGFQSRNGNHGGNVSNSSFRGDYSFGGDSYYGQTIRQVSSEPAFQSGEIDELRRANEIEHLQDGNLPDRHGFTASEEYHDLNGRTENENDHDDANYNYTTATNDYDYGYGSYSTETQQENKLDKDHDENMDSKYPYASGKGYEDEIQNNAYPPLVSSEDPQEAQYLGSRMSSHGSRANQNNSSQNKYLSDSQVDHHISEMKNRVSARALEGKLLTSSREKENFYGNENDHRSTTQTEIVGYTASEDLLSGSQQEDYDNNCALASSSPVEVDDNDNNDKNSTNETNNYGYGSSNGIKWSYQEDESYPTSTENNSKGDSMSGYMDANVDMDSHPIAVDEDDLPPPPPPPPPASMTTTTPSTSTTTTSEKDDMILHDNNNNNNSLYTENYHDVRDNDTRNEPLSSSQNDLARPDNSPLKIDENNETGSSDLAVEYSNGIANQESTSVEGMSSSNNNSISESSASASTTSTTATSSAQSIKERLKARMKGKKNRESLDGDPQ